MDVEATIQKEFNLTAKQAKFVIEYLLDLNITKAAIRAGYKEKTAYQTGSENLRKPSIEKALLRAREILQLNTGITAERVIQELARVAFSNYTDVVTFDSSGQVSF